MSDRTVWDYAEYRKLEDYLVKHRETITSRQLTKGRTAYLASVDLGMDVTTPRISHILKKMKWDWPGAKRKKNGTEDPVRVMACILKEYFQKSEHKCFIAPESYETLELITDGESIADFNCKCNECLADAGEEFSN